MVKKCISLAILLLCILVLCGCSVRTVEDLYSLPKRSQAYQNLQTLIDEVMVDMEFSAPISGENQQTVQIADLDGDGNKEYLLFTKGISQKPLQIFIFSRDGENYVLLDVVESTGAAFVQVDYADMDGRGGVELVVGYQLSDSVLRSVSVYTLAGGKMEQLLTANYSRFVCTDLDSDEKSELFILRPNDGQRLNGVAEMFELENGAVERSAQAEMSGPVDNIRRIMVSRLDDGVPAVYVASDVQNSAMVTDVFAVVRDQLTNVVFSSESGTGVQTLRNHYVYADDIDGDGVLELPSLITMTMPGVQQSEKDQYLIRWYAMTSDGSTVDKQYTYHNYIGGWYVCLDSDLAERMTVTQKGNVYEFYLWNEDGTSIQKLMSVYVLTGHKREENGVSANRFVLHRTESTVYAAELEVASGAYGMSQDGLINDFHLILQDWYTGET